MRRELLVGIGISGLLAGSAMAQLPPGYQPLPSATAPSTPPAGGLLPVGYTPLPSTPEARPLAAPPPVNLEIRTAIPVNHEWLLRPEHGAAFISVRSYSRPSRPDDVDYGPTALAMAETLAREIRDKYRVQAFLFEFISEERKAEAAAIAAARARGQQLAGQWNQLREKSQLSGMEFLEPDNKVRFKTVKYNDQIAVLIGGFKSDEDARKALDTVRKWPPPTSKVKDRMNRDVSLMDCGTIFKPGPDGKQQLQESQINPYLTATVVPNPTIAKTVEHNGAPSIDPLLVKLNEGRPYSLLMAKKTWTLGVKSFSAPVELVSGDGGTSVMRKFGSSKGGDALIAGAEQAESLAKTLREIKTKSGEPLEAFVLHTRTASLVTVGQFDGPNDPELITMRERLSLWKMNVTEDRTGFKPVANAPSVFGTVIPNARSVFGSIVPMPIPKP